MSWAIRRIMRVLKGAPWGIQVSISHEGKGCLWGTHGGPMAMGPYGPWALEAAGRGPTTGRRQATDPDNTLAINDAYCCPRAVRGINMPPLPILDGWGEGVMVTMMKMMTTENW